MTFLHDQRFSLWDLIFNELLFPHNTSKGKWALYQRMLRRSYEDNNWLNVQNSDV